MQSFTKTALVLGAGGFIGHHMVKRLRKEGYYVRAISLEKPKFTRSEADEFITADLRDPAVLKKYIELDNKPFQEVYHFAADMGGAGYLFTEEHDADIMHNSISISLNLLDAQNKVNYKHNRFSTKVFYASSACVYPKRNQLDVNNPDCKENTVYPADPDSEYGWEKLITERLLLAYKKNHKMNVRIARYHNIYGPEGTYDGGKEKVPAAICRKIAKLPDTNKIEIWGDGKQTRSFLYIDDCIEATRRLVISDFQEPINIGSEEQVSINKLVDIVAEIAGKKVIKIHKEGPIGVLGRNSNNDLIRQVLDWNPEFTLKEGLTHTYNWITERIKNERDT